jgi:hypothetical protein
MNITTQNRKDALAVFLAWESLPHETTATGLPLIYFTLPSEFDFDSYAVVTLEESATTSAAFPDNRDATQDDLITLEISGEVVTFLIIPQF